MMKKRTTLFCLTLGVAIASVFFAGCRSEDAERPTLLDSVAARRTDHVDQMTKEQAILMRAKFDGCVLGEDLRQDDLNSEMYYFAERAEGAQCPAGCSLSEVTGLCSAPSSCAGSDPEVEVECLPSTWMTLASFPSVFEPLAAEVFTSICRDRSSCEAEDATDSCGQAVCGVLSGLCAANAALELTQVRAVPYEVAVPFGIEGALATLRIPAQDVATNATLAEYAQVRARQALQASLSALLYAFDGEGGACAAEDLDVELEVVGPLADDLVSKTPAEVLSNSAVEAYDLAHEAADSFVEHAVAYADSRRTHPNRSTTAHMQLLATQVSRSAASHYLLGGTLGLPGAILETGIGTVGELTDGEREALNVMRQSGLCPADVLAIPGDTEDPPEAISTHDLIYSMVEPGDGVVGQPSMGSVRMRYMDRGFTEDPTYDFDTARSITLEHFDVARTYLAQEYLAFGRDLTRVLHGTEDWHTPAFAATQHPPEQRNAGFYAGIARTSNYRFVPDYEQGASPEADSLALNGAFNVADLRDLTKTMVGRILAAPRPATFLSDDLIDGPLGFLASRGEADVKGRVYVCAASSFTGLGVRLAGYSETDGAVLLTSPAELECFTNGNIEGTSCNSDLVAARNAREITGTPSDLAGLEDQYLERAEGGPFEVGADATHVYVVVPKSGLVGVPGPGDYRFLAAADVPTELFKCELTPVVPDVVEKVADVLAPSTDWISHPSSECDGSDFAARIPLEDELTEDHDEVESSWRHYLALAKQAAAEADLLAQEYVQAGLDVDRREEEIELRDRANEVAAIHRLGDLQRICGTNVDTSELLEAFRGNGEGDFSNVAQPPEGCDPSDPTCSCSNGYECPEPTMACFAGTCLRTTSEEIAARVSEDPEFAKLSRCLGGDESTYAAVTLGDTPQCFWRHPDDPAQICAPKCPDGEATCVPDAYQPCPVNILPDSDFSFGVCPPGIDPWGAELGREIERTDDELGYFVSRDRFGIADHGPISAACNQLRDVRAGTLSGPVNSSIYENSRIFNGADLRAIANRVGFEADADSIAVIRVDGEPRWSTLPGPAGLRETWPCADEYQCDGLDSLFCRVNSGCDIASVRGQASQRMAETVLTLRAIGEGTTRGHGVVSWGGIFLPHSVNDNISSLPAGETLNLVSGPIKLGWTRPASRLIYSETGAPIWQVGSESSPALLVAVPDISESGACRWLDSFFFKHDGTLQEDMQWDVLATDNPRFRTCPSIGTFLMHDPEHPVLDEALVSWDHVGAADGEGLDLELDYGFQLTNERALDALELYCKIREEEVLLTRTECNEFNTSPLQLNSADDLKKVSGRLICMGERTKQRTANALLLNFPRDAVDALRVESAQGSYPLIGGDLGAAVSSLRADLVLIANSGAMIASELRQLGLDIDSLRLFLEQTRVQEQMRKIDFDLRRLASTTACETAFGGALGDVIPGQGVLEEGGAATLAWASFGFRLASSAATTYSTCASSRIQEDLLNNLEALTATSEELAREMGVLDFRGRFEARSDALRDIAASVSTAQERLDISLATIENLRLQARRSLDEAVWLSSHQATQQFNINSAVRRRFNTASVRYREAHQHAKRLAILARKAIEARLGVRLETMDQPLALVEAPRTWVSSVCATSALDYDAVREVLLDSEDDDANYADAFIGAYVRNLEGVVESYRLANNFHEGIDTAVISLRDDIVGSRKECRVQGRNLVARSGGLGLADTWRAEGCALDEEGLPLPGCVYALLNGAGAGPRTSYTFAFGNPPNDAGDSVPCAPGQCGFTPESRWVQSLRLGPGDYILSWQARQPSGGDPSINPDGRNSVRLLNEDGSAISDPGDLETVGVSTSGWTRYAWRFSLAHEEHEAFLVGVVPAADGPDPLVPHHVMIAQIMLEVDRGQDEPSVFESTDENALVSERVCEDSEGSEFRKEWGFECARLCTNGFSGDCPNEIPDRCYHHFSFDIDQKDLELGRLLSRAGFAVGNFNYRIENIAVNFVGTDIRECEDSDLPQSCYSAGFVQYSLEHNGPFHIRNHRGDSFAVPLFDGRIEHARGLALERYITNPPSDADMSLLAEYTRDEFQGRPLDGRFTIKAWADDDGFDFRRFGSVQDVQLVVKYRYWTRFD